MKNNYFHVALFFSINDLISEILQTVVRLPSLTGFGNLPSFTPAHQLDLEMGMIAGVALFPTI